MNRLEEIEAALASPPEPTHYPVDIDHLSAADIAWLSQREVTKADVAWLCAEVRRLHGQLERAEAVAAAYRKAYEDIVTEIGPCQCDEWWTASKRHSPTCAWHNASAKEIGKELRAALAAWKEAGDDTE